MNKQSQLPIPFGWYAVAFGADLAKGEVKPLSYFGRELVIFRTESGAAKVLDAYCPHLGAHLGHGGSVKGEAIACPFHGWQFNGAGQCTAVPYAKNMPPRVAGNKEVIYAYPTIERNQIIWAWYHPNRTAPTYEVDEIPELSDPAWTPIERMEWTIGTSLQEVAENAVDAAHFIFVHGTPQSPTGESTFQGTTRRSTYTIDTGRPAPEGKPDRQYQIFLDTISNGSGMGLQRFTGAMNVMMMGLPVPIDENNMKLFFVFTQPKDLSDRQKMMALGAQLELKRQVEADIPIWEHKAYLESPTLCDGDGPIHQYRKWFRQFYAELNDPTNIRAVK